MRVRRWLCVFFALVLACACVCPAFAQGARVMRVGYFLVPGLQELDEDGLRSGYGYDYLQAVAQRTGWTYEYVDGKTYRECLEMLAGGQIDLMSTVYEGNAYQDRMLLSQNTTGNDTTRLVVTKDNTKYAYNDYQAFDGMRVGLLDGRENGLVMERLARAQGFACTLQAYALPEQLMRALEDGAVDAALVSDLNNIDGYRIISQFNPVRTHFAMPSGREDDMAALDGEISHIKQYEPSFEAALENKHFGWTNDITAALSRQEMAYVESNPVVRVVYDAAFAPISYTDKNGEFCGIMRGVFDIIASRTGLTFEYLKADAYTDALALFRQTSAELIITVNGDYEWAYEYGASITQSLLEASVVCVSAPGAMNGERIALPRGYYTQAQIARITQNAQVLFYQTPADCFEAILRREADRTYISAHAGKYYINRPRYRNFNVELVYGLNEDLSIGVADSADARLLGIIQKTVSSISENEMDALAHAESTKPVPYKLLDYIAGEPVEVLRIIAAISGVILLLFAFILRANHHKRRALVAMNQRTQELRRQAEFDTLTGIYNKETFYRATQEMLERDAGTQYVLVLWNIERFKVINDMYGIEKGDEVLIQMANLFKRALPGVGTFGRLESDRFITCSPRAQSDADKAMRDVSACFAALNLDQDIIVNLGLYVVEDITVPVNQMVDRAKLALSTISGSYIKRYAYYSDSMRDALIAEQQIVNDMNTALEDGQFQIYLQPQFNHVSGSLVGAEALVRWFHPQKGMISPALFIPTFEKNGFITRMDEYVWERACALQRALLDKGLLPVPVSVNISRVDIYNKALGDKLQSLINKYRLEAHLLRLEITESAYMEHPQQLIDAVQALRERGFYIEMDDFGSGYSSLNTLKDVPVDMLKLDMRFLSGENSGRGGSILQSIVHMAHWLSLPVIAEGVETVEQADFLRSIGCNVIQGYLYSRPLPIAAFEKLLARCDVTPENEKVRMLSNVRPDDFWDPQSQMTLIFNRFVGGAGVFEYYDGKLEALRMNDMLFEETDVSRELLARSRRTLMDYVHPDDLAAFTAALLNAITTYDEVECDTRFLLPFRSDNLRWLRLRMQIIARSNARYVFFINIQNITKQMEKISAQVKEGSKIKTIVDNSPFGIATYEVVDRHQVFIRFISPQFARQCGYSPEEMLDTNAFAMVDDASRERLLEAIKDSLLHNGRLFRCAVRYYCKDGTAEKRVLFASRLLDSEARHPVYLGLFINSELLSPSEDLINDA